MIAVGVDTHKQWHVVVAMDALGQVLGELVIAATGAGYGELVAWLSGLEGEVVVGIEGAGSYGAGLCQHLRDAAVVVVEVERPRRRDRRAGSRITSTRYWRRGGCLPARASRRRGQLAIALR